MKKNVNEKSWSSFFLDRSAKNEFIQSSTIKRTKKANVSVPQLSNELRKTIVLVGSSSSFEGTKNTNVFVPQLSSERGKSNVFVPQLSNKRRKSNVFDPQLSNGRRKTNVFIPQLSMIWHCWQRPLFFSSIVLVFSLFICKIDLDPIFRTLSCTWIYISMGGHH